MAIKEANKENIRIKSIILNNNNNNKLSKMFGKKNYQTIIENRLINKQFMHFIRRALTE